MTMKWYVLRSKPNKEMALWGELTARGYECFYPKIYARPVDPRSRKIRPYFPGYLFLHGELENIGVSTLQWMPFSTGLVSFGGIPATVPENLVQAIGRQVEAVNAAIGKPLTGLKRGERVIIEDGLFAGYEAIFDARLPGRERVRVLLKLLYSRQVHVELPESQIRVVPSQKPRR